jgi:hypothetical protein
LVSLRISTTRSRRGAAGSRVLLAGECRVPVECRATFFRLNPNFSCAQCVQRAGPRCAFGGLCMPVVVPADAFIAADSFSFFALAVAAATGSGAARSAAAAGRRDDSGPARCAPRPRRGHATQSRRWDRDQGQWHSRDERRVCGHEWAVTDTALHSPQKRQRYGRAVARHMSLATDFSDLNLSCIAAVEV